MHLSGVGNILGLTRLRKAKDKEKQNSSTSNLPIPSSLAPDRSSTTRKIQTAVNLRKRTILFKRPSAESFAVIPPTFEENRVCVKQLSVFFDDCGKKSDQMLNVIVAERVGNLQVSTGILNLSASISKSENLKSLGKF